MKRERDLYFYYFVFYDDDQDEDEKMVEKKENATMYIRLHEFSLHFSYTRSKRA